MAELIPAVTAALGVADVAIRAIHGIFKLVSALREASAELRYLEQHLHGLEQVLLRVKDLRLTYATSELLIANEGAFGNIDDELKLCAEDLTELQKLLGRPKRRAESTYNRFGKAIKTVFSEDRIEKIAQRVERRKTSVSAMLLVIGSRNELVTQKKLNTIQTGQDTMHEALNRNEDVLHSICAKTTITNEQLASFSRLADSKLDKLDRLDRLLESLPVLIAREKGDCNVIISGSAKRAAASLPLVLPFLPKVFQSLNRQSSSPILSRSDMKWLKQEFRSFHLAVLREAAEEMACYPGGARLRRPTHPLWVQEHLGENAQTASSPVCGTKNAKTRTLAVRQTKLDLQVFPGRLLLFTSESAPDKAFQSAGRIIDGIRLLFFPRTELRVSGFVVSSAYDWRGNCTISPVLSTFGVVSASQPIWRLIDTGDINGVRRLLGKRLNYPSDRDAESGNSLLAWAAWNHQLEICQLLIQEGADVMNCAADGSSALSVFFQAIRHSPKRGNKFVDGSRALITACGSDVVESDQHIAWDGSFTGTYLHGIVHRIILETFPAWLDATSLQSCYESLEILLQRGADPNERNGWGRTPLVTATFQVCLPMLPKVLRLLLRYGADPTVVDGDGEGILTRLLPTLCCCDVGSMGAAWADEVVDVVASLLRAGCDTNLSGTSGWTPSDSCLAPTAWVIWCESLSRAGHDVGAVIGRDDEADGLAWTEDELAQRCLGALKSDPLPVDAWPVPHDLGDQIACHVCGSRRSWRPTRSPFDLVGSYFRSGFSYHLPLHNHANGRFCANYAVPSSCDEGEHDDEGFPLWPTAADFSWRKHVAHKLWKSRRLGLCVQAAEWSATMSP